jgi:hypothetical protein
MRIPKQVVADTSLYEDEVVGMFLVTSRRSGNERQLPSWL